MMFSIIVAIAVFVVIVIARRMLNGEDAVTTNMYVKAIVIALVVGAIDYLSTIISGETGTLWLCWVFLVVMLCLYAWLAYWWQAEGGTWTEMIPFAILAGLFYWPAKAAAMTTTAFCDSNVTAGIIAILPTLALVAVLGYFIASHLWFLHNEVDQVHRGDKPEIKEQKQRKASLRKGLAIASAFVTAFALALVVYSGVDWSAEQPDSEASAATTQETQEMGGDEKFVQNWTDNGNNRLDNQFATKLAEKAKAQNGEITTDIVEETVLDNCGHDARMLAIWANAFSLWADPNNYEPLLTSDKKYLSEEGIKLYYKLEGYLKATKIVREPAPEDGTNTGYDNGYVVAGTSGISGDRSGTKFTSPDKEIEPFWLMDRCSNLVYKRAPKNVPKGKTDDGKGDNPEGPKYNKDPNKAPKADTEPNDDKGPGPDTNNPKDPSHSSKDTGDSSTSGSYDDYKKGVEEKKETNQNQKKGGDSNTPSTSKPSPKANVDNNADKGTGNGSIDKPTPVKPKAKEADSGKEIDSKAGEAWEGPAD